MSPTCRDFGTTRRQRLNPLLNLAGLSFSKEAQYLSKERKIPREEFTPYLELIRSSEVDPFAPAPGTSPTVLAALRRAQRGESDMQTAFGLAISNLALQLDASRAETRQAIEALTRLQEKHQRQEKHALLMVLGIVAFISVISFKPDALEVVGKNWHELQQSWKRFDWQWLGNPPDHKSKAMSPPVAKPINPAPNHIAASPTSSGAVETSYGISLAPASSSSVEDSNGNIFALTRLFWASTGNE